MFSIVGFLTGLVFTLAGLVVVGLFFCRKWFVCCGLVYLGDVALSRVMLCWWKVLFCLVALCLIWCVMVYCLGGGFG